MTSSLARHLRQCVGSIYEEVVGRAGCRPEAKIATFGRSKLSKNFKTGDLMHIAACANLCLQSSDWLGGFLYWRESLSAYGTVSTFVTACATICIAACATICMAAYATICIAACAQR